jgi:circadian clock protein KaiC
MDAWLDLKFVESDSERNRGLSVIKARGMAHSNQTRELVFTQSGVELRDVYLGPAGGLVMGTSRAALEASERANALAGKTEAGIRKRELEHKLKALDAQIAALSSELATGEGEMEKILSGEGLRDEVLAQNRNDMARLRKADISN